MARSFWSKRTTDPTSVGAVSRPMSIALMIIGIVIVGGLLFGVFQGAKWSFNKLSGNDTVATNPSNTSTNTQESTTTPVNNPPITATSSTATTTPSASATPTATPPKPTTVPATNTQALPSTGPTSNAAIFFGVLIVSYLVSRRLSLKNQ